MEAVASNDVRIRNVLGRLEMIIDNENSRIGVDPDFDIKTSNAHKSRCLYELTMLHRDAIPGEISPAFVSQTRHLRNKLRINSQKVEAHLEAVRSVVDLLKTAAQDADADGIYTEAQFRYSDF
ncbi:hypothetical protein [Sinorhizobium terangae]|uniref:Flagellar protein FlgN n=1 Tax=Sinorhizobium terangae TaxID=110322 RepID=A0A6N7LE29_SINTE|nr:hypothetical protein [Sinorhizobium terangae]MBB4184016.1 hypothetical protein [Sinorhizobium terangae]MQX14964.1 hypothetical protein [Sinorhizobium terangae]WFU48121.1 hypothetical protein QA637_01490 [Sinorhizobium terangae]